MRFAAPFPWWLAALLLAGAALVAHRAYIRPIVSLTLRRRVLLSSLRFLTLVTLLLCLAQPVRLASVPADVVVPVLVDHSRSMGLSDAADGGSRLEAALTFAERLAAALDDEVRLELLGIGADVMPIDPSTVSPEAPRSELGSALAEVGARYDTPVPGVVLLSDGAATGRLASDAGGPPVFPVGFGAPTAAPDREVLGLRAGRAVVAASTVDLAVSVAAPGFGTDPIPIQVLQDGRLVQVVEVTPAADGAPVRRVIPVAPDTDHATTFSVQIPVDPTERVPENNVRAVLVPPASRPRRLLLVEGGPGYEHSFLKRVLRSDPGLGLDAVIQKGQNDRGERTFYIQGAVDRTRGLDAGFPATRAALFAYDAVLLANLDPTLLRPAQAELLEAFVSERGGGLLVMGTRSFDGTGLRDLRLDRLLPLAPGDGGARRPFGSASRDETPRSVSLTPAGRAHPIMRLGPGEALGARWAAMPALGAVAPLGPPTPGASVLLTAAGGGRDERPVVALQRFGRGRTMVFAADASWRWKMLAASTDDAYDRFWRQTARWLSADAPEPVRVQVEGGRAAGDPLRVRVAVADERFTPVADARVTVRVEAPGGEVAVVPALSVVGEDGAYLAVVEATERGVYRVTADVAVEDAAVALDRDRVETTALVGGADPELADPRRQDDVLERLARGTGGRVLDPGQVVELAGALRSLVATDGAVASDDLWDTPVVFLSLVGLLSVEWGLRRRWGLR